MNHIFFGMPPSGALLVIVAKSSVLAIAAAYVAYKAKNVSILAILAVVLAYQVIGTLIEWAIVKDFFVALQDFRIGIPGILFQVVGGYFLLKVMAKL
jgi:hypothetical protein